MIAVRTLARRLGLPRLSVPQLLRALSIAVAVEAGLLALAGLGALSTTQDDVTRSADLHSLRLALADTDREASDEFLSGCTTHDRATGKTVALAYCPGSVESGLVEGDHRMRYDRAVTMATTDLNLLVQDSAGGGGTGEQLRNLDNDFGSYTKRVDTGRADTRLGLPVGAAYLRAASMMMHPDPKRADPMNLPGQLDTLEGAQTVPDSAPLTGALLLTIVLLATLVAGQAYLRRRFRRRYNVGLGAATLLLVPVLAWTVFLVVVTGPLPGQPLDRWHQAQNAQALVHYAAADVSRVLMSGGGTDDAFEQDAGGVGPLVAGTPAEATFQEFKQVAEEDIYTPVMKGDLSDAVLRLSTFEDTFQRLDRQLQVMLRDAANQLARGMGVASGADGSVRGGGAVRLLPVAIGLAAILLAGIGLQPRIDEYRRLR